MTYPSSFVVLRDPLQMLTWERSSWVSRTAFAGGSIPPTPELRVEELNEPSDRRALREDSTVVAAAPLMRTRLITPVSDRSHSVEAITPTTGWGVAAVGANDSPFTGQGVVVAVLDTGIDQTHPAFSGMNLEVKDFTGEGATDNCGHGTHCAGTIFGRSPDVPMAVAPGVQHALIGKVLQDSGEGTTEHLFEGLQWALFQRAQVISMSLGFDFPGEVAMQMRRGWEPEVATSLALDAYRANLRLFDAFMAFVRAREAFGLGAVIVAAAGNESRRHIDRSFVIGAGLPAAAEGVVCVGAIQPDCHLAPFSNAGVTVVAPGVEIISARPGGGTTSMTGTSMAAPHVAGVAALWWEAARRRTGVATPYMVKSMLVAHARNDLLVAVDDPTDIGAGLVSSPTEHDREGDP